MREVCGKLPKTSSGQPAFDKHEEFVRWPYYKPMLFMKDQFIGRDLHGSFHDDITVEPTVVGSDASEDQALESSTPHASSSGLNRETDCIIRKSKKARLNEEFLQIEREKMRNLQAFITKSNESSDEWTTFCSAISHDLRKLTDPMLMLRTKATINAVINNAVLQQLSMNSNDSSQDTSSAISSDMCSSDPPVFPDSYLGHLNH